MFFDIFKDLCDRKGISPKRAADDMGLSNSITTKWKKTGATPNGETLNRIAEYFGVTIDYLLSGKEKAPTQAGERKSDLDTAKIALFGGGTEVTDEMWDEAVLAADSSSFRRRYCSSTGSRTRARYIPILSSYRVSAPIPHV